MQYNHAININTKLLLLLATVNVYDKATELVSFNHFCLHSLQDLIQYPVTETWETHESTDRSAPPNYKEAYS